MNSLARTLYGQRKDVVVSDDNCSLCNSDPEKSQCDSENAIPNSQAESSELSSLLLDDTLNSTFSPSQLDATYTNDIDDSITTAKTIARSTVKTTGADKPKRKQTGATKGRSTTKDVKNEPFCVEKCEVKTSGDMTQCNLCMKWFHDKCVGIKKSDNVGWWCCGGCRQMTANVSTLIKNFTTFAGSVSKQITDMSSDINSRLSDLSATFSNRLQQLDDRVTALANQNKGFASDITASQNDIEKSVSAVKTHFDKKINTLMTKTQSIIDRIQTVPDSAPSNHSGKPVPPSNSNSISKSKETLPLNNRARNVPRKNKSPTQSENQGKLSQNNKGNNPSKQTNQRDEVPKNTYHRDATVRKGNLRPQTSHKQKKRVAPLTLIVGSDALKGISTKRLSNRVRVKTFDGAQIQQLREKLNAMNLEPYEKIVLHIGECDVSAGSDVETVSSNMHELLLDLRAKFTVAVSGMLPMKGFNIKAFNSEIKKLCGEYDVEYIDHHDSFVMASGEVPRSLFYGKNQSLRPAGTATLVSNLDSKCSILRKHDADMTSPHKAGESPSNPLYI